MFSFDLDAAIWLWPLVDESSFFRIVDAAFPSFWQVVYGV